MSLTKNIIISAMLTIAVAANAANSREFTYQGLRYSVRDEIGKTCRLAEGDITGIAANTYSGYLTIPAKVWDGDTEYEVYEIGRNTFQGCETLTGVKIPDTVREIGASAFKDCWQMTEAVIGSRVRVIAPEAFYGCSYLAGISIPDEVQEMGLMAFAYCERMQYVTIGSSLAKVGWDPFYDCIGVKRVETNCPTIAKEWFADSKGLRELVTGDRTTTIATGAFKDFTNLERLTLGRAVSWIGPEAFAGCIRLADIKANPMNPPAIAESTFSQTTYDNATLSVPASAENSYRTNPCWGKFFDSSGITNAVSDHHGISIEGNTVINPGNLQITIYTMTGSVAYSGSAQRIGHLAHGAYILAVEGDRYKIYF